MSHDLERRVRDALRSAPLPVAPESVRATLLKITADTGAAPRRQNRAAGWLIPAAVVAVLVVALAGVIGTGRQPSPAGPSAGPTDAGPEPPADVQVLSAAELEAAIAAQRAGDLAPRDVVVDVAIDATRQTPALARECVPVGTCQVIGTLDGFSDPGGTVTIRQAESVLPPPITPADLRPPIALRLSDPIEYLGHVGLNGSTKASTVPEALAATATAPDGEVIAVDGWLEGTGGGWSCGPAPMPGPPVPEPFRCHVTPMLTAGPVKPVTRSGNQRSLSFPPGSVPLQEGAYEQYAPNPASDGTNDEPRHGLYLLRMVVHDAVNCPGCRGWLVVGRLDAATTPAPTTSPAAGVTVRSAAELALLLQADRSAWVGRAVFVDGHVVPRSAQGCQADATCQIGILEGTDEKVVASAYTVSLLLPDTDYPTNGLMAVIVRDQGLEYLGWMGYNADNTFVLAVDQLLDPQHMARGPETVVVTGWLIDSGSPLRCPPPSSPAPPPDTPFETCPFAWLASDETQPVTVTPNGKSVRGPPNAIRVQPAAYTEFAPDPAWTENGVAHVPRYGTYLLRLVSNPPSAADPQRGWQVVARLSRADALASPAATPVTELPVDASIEPVRLSDPSSEAADALRICHVGDNIGADMVSGMGRIDHARDAVRYVSLAGLEPEIQTDAPAWIVTFKGEVPMPKSGEIWIDPTCIVVKGDGGFYAIGPVKILSSAVTVTPLPAKQKPELALPPLLP